MAKDLYHEAVKKALINDNWIITHDGYRLGDKELEYEVDLGAERLLAATNGKEKVLVEVKSFAGQSKAYEFHRALGQFNSYLLALEEQEPDRTLYVAVPNFIFDSFFQKALIKRTIQRYQMKILVFDPVHQNIVQWIK